MILDTSAVLALAFLEPERDDFLAKIDAARVVGIGAPSVVEAAIVLSGRIGESGPDELRDILQGAGIVVVGFEAQHWQVAADAWLRFGRGRHPARLNLGDCFAYATARVAGRPLLFKGEDFAKTDVARA